MKYSAFQAIEKRLIDYLPGIQDEKVFDKLEANIYESIKAHKPSEFVFSKAELIERAEFSNKEIKKEQVLR